MISRALRESDLQARYLEVEITESVPMQDSEATFRNLKALTAMGVTIVIDDFGIGYSSLSYLRKLPIRKLKIDKSFVFGLPGDSDSKAIVTAIIAMAHSMKLCVLAEGVETEEQRDCRSARLRRDPGVSDQAAPADGRVGENDKSGIGHKDLHLCNLWIKGF